MSQLHIPGAGIRSQHLAFLANTMFAWSAAPSHALLALASKTTSNIFTLKNLLAADVSRLIIFPQVGALERARQPGKRNDPAHAGCYE